MWYFCLRCSTCWAKQKMWTKSIYSEAELLYEDATENKFTMTIFQMEGSGQDMMMCGWVCSCQFFKEPWHCKGKWSMRNSSWTTGPWRCGCHIPSNHLSQIIWIMYIYFVFPVSDEVFISKWYFKHSTCYREASSSGMLPHVVWLICVDVSEWPAP